MKFNAYDNVLVKGTLRVTTVLEDRCNGYYYCSDRGTYSESEIEITDMPSNDGVEELEDITNKNDVTLTQPELQFLTKFLSDTLCGLQIDIKYYETCAANIWDKCNKEDEHAARWFKTMNHYKDHNKELKKTVKKLSVVQGKLKRQVGK